MDNIKDQYREATKNNKVIRKAYHSLMRWDNKVFTQTEFRNYILKGYLKKKVNKNEFWQTKKYHKRYFIADFREANLIIMRDKDSKDKKNMRSIMFRDIIACT